MSEQKQITEPNFESIESDEDLINKVKQYVKFSVEEYNMDVDINYIVDYQIMKRAKRRAACVQYKKQSNFTVGVERDKRELTESFFGLTDDPRSLFIDSIMKVSDKAFKEFSDSECKDTIRHELIHVIQHQKYGVSNHGAEFERLADKYNCEKHCRKFTDYKYILNCKECGDFVTGKYRKCKTVKNPELYKSRCCDASLKVINQEEKDNNEDEENEQEDNKNNEEKQDEFKGEIILEKIVEDYRYGEQIKLDTEYKTDNGYFTKKDIKKLDFDKTKRSWEGWVDDGEGAWLVEKESKNTVKEELENMGWKVIDKI